jgi:uncharacterized protein YegL
MNLSRVFCLLVSLFSITWITANGQGIIIPRPCTRPEIRCPQPPQIPQQPLKVKNIRFDMKVTDQAAVTHVEQVFVNDTPFVLEGVYFFPLPDGVSITEFAMWDGDKRLVGEVRSKQEARRIYDDIVRSRRDPALLEYAGKNLFQASIFPIQPNSEKKIELTYSQVLQYEGGTVAYRYPLGVGWRANGIPITRPQPPVRPFNGRERDWPSSTGNQSLGVVSGSIEIVSRTALKNIYSPSHEIEVKRDGERKAKLSFETRAGSAWKDFLLFYTVSDQDLGLSLLTHREPGKDGYFLLLVSPKAQLDEKEVAAKEVVFVLDTSGSMSDDGKMEKARAALRFGVKALNPRDRFNIVSFAGEEHLLSEQMLLGDEAGKKSALEFIDRMKAVGGTNINDALQAALKMLKPDDRPQLIVLMTDGQPTVGETSAARIMANAKQSNQSKARLFTFGVGYDVNTVLLDGLANENRGSVSYIEPNEDIEIKVSNFFMKVNNPVLSDVAIDWGGVKTDLIYPRATPDIFHGSQLAILGRYRPADRAAQKDQPSRTGGNALVASSGASEAKHRVALTGKVNGRERRFVFENLSFPGKETDNDFLPHLWAMRRVGFLLDQIRLNGESKELRDEIVDLGTRYGIVTPYTSQLVLEPGMQVSQNSNQQIQGLSNLPMNGRGGRLKSQDQPRESAKAPSAAPGAVSEAVTVTGGGVPLEVAGKDAVVTSIKQAELRQADKAESAETVSGGKMRQASGKTFYLRDDVWTDSDYKLETKLPVIKLTFASDEFFKLLAQEPKLADCFALGKKVVVVWEGKVYQVTE